MIEADQGRAMVKGGCECGAFRYAVEGKPKTVVACHCSRCQRQSGSAFGMSMIIDAWQFLAVRGELQCFERPGASGNMMLCHFCPRCGTRIYNQKRGGEDIVILKPGTLDDSKKIAPTRQLWTSEKQGWINLPELPSFERQSG